MMYYLKDSLRSEVLHKLVHFEMTGFCVVSWNHTIKLQVTPVSFRQPLHGTGSFGTGTKLVRISLVFTRGLLDPVRIGSTKWVHL